MLAALLLPLASYAPQSCGNGATTTLFTSNGGYAGHMFDVAPSVDMTIGCLDANFSTAGVQVDVTVWWCPGTVVGNDQNQLGTWTAFASGSGTSAGLDLPTAIALTPLGTNPVFLAGATYGIYVQFTNYATAGGSMRHTNVGGPTTYPGTHCDLTAYYSKGDGIGSATFAFRAWNGTLRTDTAAPLRYRRIGSCPGNGSLAVDGATPLGRVHFLLGSAGASFVPAGKPCAGTPLGLAAPAHVAALTADASGAIVVPVRLPAAACGRSSQVLDEPTCKISLPIQF